MELIPLLRAVLDEAHYAEYIGATLTVSDDNELLLFNVGESHTAMTSPSRTGRERIYFKQDEAEEIKYLVAKCYLKYRKNGSAKQAAAAIATAYEQARVQLISREAKHILENLKERCNNNLQGNQHAWKGQASLVAKEGDELTPARLSELEQRAHIKIHNIRHVTEADQPEDDEIAGYHLRYTVSITKLGWETR